MIAGSCFSDLGRSHQVIRHCTCESSTRPPVLRDLVVLNALVANAQPEAIRVPSVAFGSESSKQLEDRRVLPAEERLNKI